MDSATPGTGNTALLLASRHGHLEVVRLLLEFGADKDLATIEGGTALMLAAQEGHVEIARLLLDMGASKDLTTSNGTTALMLASGEGHLGVLQLLLKAGADKNLATHGGKKGLAEVGSFPLRDRHHVCDSSAVMIESRAQSSLTSLYTSRRPSVKTLSFKQYYLPSSTFAVWARAFEELGLSWTDPSFAGCRDVCVCCDSMGGPT